MTFRNSCGRMESMDENESISSLKLKNLIVHSLKMFLITVKPWKKREEGAFKDTIAYACGWNDCIKEMKKEGDNYIKKIQNL